MSTIQDGTRSDEARARVEDRNNLDAINKIYVGTGESITVNGHTVWQTEGKNIIKAIDDAGTVAKATNAASATNADYAATAGNATTSDSATDSQNVTNTINGKQISKIFETDGVTAKNATYAENTVNTDFTNVVFKSGASGKLQLSENGFYYFRLSFNTSFGILYWGKGFNTCSAICIGYQDLIGSPDNITEICIAISEGGVVTLWEKGPVSTKWSAHEDISIYYKKIR